MRIHFYIFVLLVSIPAIAEQTRPIAECIKIADELQRLDCYDSVATHYQKYDLQGDAPQADDKIILSKEESFGKTLSQITEVESIQTTIVGDFKGWEKGMIIRLANGQSWKVISRSTGHVRFKNPEVEISKGFMGSFNMQVKGLNKKAKVKRVK